MNMLNLGRLTIATMCIVLLLGHFTPLYSETSYDLLAKDIAVFPISESKQSKLSKKIQQIIIDVLSDEFTEYNIISEDKIDTFLSENAVTPGEAIGPVILEKALLDLPCNTVIFGNVISMNKIKKVLVKILISKKLYEYYNFTFDLPIQYTMESLSETVKDNLKEAFNNLPYKGFISNADGTIVEIKAQKRDTIQVGRILRVIRITAIEEHPLLKKITNVTKEEIGAIKVTMIGAESIKGEVVKVKANITVKNGDLIDFEESELYKAQESATTQDKTVDDAFSEETNVANEIQDNEFEETTQEKKDKQGQPTQVIEEANTEEMVSVNQSGSQMELSVGLIAGASIEKNSLTSLVTTTITGGDKSIYTFGNGGAFVDFWPIKYLGIYAQYQKAFLSGYSVTITFEGLEPQSKSVGFFTDEITALLKGRLPLTKSEHYPWIGLRLGYEYKNVSIDKLISETGEIYFMPSTKYYSPLVGLEFRVPFIPSFGVRGFFDYWFLPKSKEDPVGATGTAPLLFTFTSGGGFFLNLSKHFELDLDYNIDYHTVSYLEAGKRYGQTITEGNISDLFHKLLFSVAYKF